MATKLEQDAERRQYFANVHQANQALADNDFNLALRRAAASLTFVESAYSYERRYEKNEHFAFAAHDLIFRTAPPLFAFQALDTVEAHLNETKKMEKNSDYDFRGQLQNARDQMRLAAQLWDAVRQQTVSPVQLREGRDLISIWERLGCAFTAGATCRLALQLDCSFRGKCSFCGAVSTAKKSSLLKEVRCPKCSAVSHLVLLAPIAKG